MPRVSVRPSWPTRGESVESVREDFPEGTSVVFREKLGSSIYIVGEIEREDGQKGVNLLDPIRVEAGSDKGEMSQKWREHLRELPAETLNEEAAERLRGTSRGVASRAASTRG